MYDGIQQHCQSKWSKVQISVGIDGRGLFAHAMSGNVLIRWWLRPSIWRTVTISGNRNTWFPAWNQVTLAQSCMTKIQISQHFNLIASQPGPSKFKPPSSSLTTSVVLLQHESLSATSSIHSCFVTILSVRGAHDYCGKSAECTWSCRGK